MQALINPASRQASQRPDSLIVVPMVPAASMLHISGQINTAPCLFLLTEKGICLLNEMYRDHPEVVKEAKMEDLEEICNQKE